MWPVYVTTLTRTLTALDQVAQRSVYCVLNKSPHKAGVYCTVNVCCDKTRRRHLPSKLVCDSLDGPSTPRLAHRCSVDL